MRTASVCATAGPAGVEPGDDSRSRHGRRGAAPRRPQPSAQARCAASSAGMAKTKTASAFMPIRPTSDTALHQQRHRHRRVAEAFQGKPVRTMAAQPFGKAESRGERGDAADAVGPEQPGERRGEALEQRQHRRQAETARGNAQANSRPRPAGRRRSTTGRRGNSRSRTTSRSRRPGASASSSGRAPGRARRRSARRAPERTRSRRRRNRRAPGRAPPGRRPGRRPARGASPTADIIRRRQALHAPRPDESPARIGCITGRPAGHAIQTGPGQRRSRFTACCRSAHPAAALAAAFGLA